MLSETRLVAQNSTPRVTINHPGQSRTFVEFFAGIGLVRLGLEQAGWECLFANDIDPKKRDFYEKNFDSEHFVLQDIWSLDVSLLPQDATLFTASFPCVDLSVAGNRKGIKGVDSGTYWAFIKVLKSLKKIGRLPNMILLENVSGFLTSNGGNDVKVALNSLNKLGYTTDIFLLDARNFTPQSRERVFVIGLKDGAATNCMVRYDPHLGDPVSYRRLSGGDERLRPSKIQKIFHNNPQLRWGLLDLPSPPRMNSSLRNIIEILPDTSERWWSTEKRDKLLSQMPPKHLEIVKHHINDEEYFYGTVYRRIREGSTRAELRTDGLAGCLRTPRGGSSKQIVVSSGKGDVRARWMTPREYGRLQGVDDEFQLPENDTQSYFGFGDAVCVPAIKWIAEHVLEQAFKS